MIIKRIAQVGKHLFEMQGIDEPRNFVLKRNLKTDKFDLFCERVNVWYPQNIRFTKNDTFYINGNVAGMNGTLVLKVGAE